ncbi:MAG TPA: MOSC domain-containing protein [Kofleriaceae bacterium]|nr:MOSC domain-containing protein [Kofleriaceae bacterium]
MRAGQERSGFPWLTIRDHAALARYQPRLVEPARPEATAVRVRTPAGAELDVLDPVLAEELGPGVRAMKLDRGAFDTLPLALISSQTLAGLSDLVGRALAAERFRPNILIDGVEGAAYVEDRWVGATLRVGAVRMRVDKRDQRCVMVNVDPSTGTRDPAVLRTISHERQSCLGVYGSIATPGTIAVGDPVVLDA